MEGKQASRQAKAGSVAAPGSLCACERLLQLRVWGDEQEYLGHGDRGAPQYASALRAAVGNTRLCVATPYWASEVLRACDAKRLCCVCWKTAREANGRRLAPDPIDVGVAFACLWLPRAWGALELQKIRPPCLCYLDGDSREQISWLRLTRPLELPSGATLWSYPLPG
jgi:hypothetical protein